MMVERFGFPPSSPVEPMSESTQLPWAVPDVRGFHRRGRVLRAFGPSSFLLGG